MTRNAQHELAHQLKEQARQLGFDPVGLAAVPAVAIDRAAAQQALNDACHRFLSNPVIEDYRLEIAD